MTIYRTLPTANYTVISNTLIDSVIPAKAKTVLLYLLSKPPAWTVKINDIRKRLGLSMYSARQALQWLANAGYVAYQRLKSGHTIWSVYENPTPQTRATLPQVEIPQVENQHDLVKTESLVKTEQLPEITELPEIMAVNVVVSDPLEEKPSLSDSIKPSQKKAAQKILASVTSEQAALILMVFNAAIASKNISNPIGYLHALTNAAKNGSLSPISSNQPITLAERLAREKKQREESAKRAKVDNESFFNMLVRKYGYVVPQ